MPWTEQDERLLKELTERKQAVQNVLRDCVTRMTAELKLHHCVDADEAARDLIANAEQIRKVLEPFDTSLPNHIKLED